MRDAGRGLYPERFGDAALSAAFQRAWLGWQVRWAELLGHLDDQPASQERVAEAAQNLARQLWRDAFAQVGESAREQVQNCVYAFVALLDEQLVFDTWPGQAAWQQRPLEARLYNTRIAGDRLPRAIHQLLETRSPVTRDLANVYLQCLLLGFHGRLRGPKGEALHEKWRQALYAHAWQRDAQPEQVGEVLERPVSAALERLPLRRTLPDGVRLALVVLAGVVLLTALGHWFWSDIRNELAPVLHLAHQLDVEEPSA